VNDELLEQVVGAWRPQSPEGDLRPHPAWHDLDDAGRHAAFRETARQRALEAALDPEGLSTTARAILARIRGT
jgi:hypothetical protein